MHIDAPTQARMRSLCPASSLRTMCGSAMWARIIPTMSTSPSAIACRAVATSAIRFAWKIGRLTRSRNRPANSSAGPSGVPIPGMTWEMASSVAIEPLMRLMKSIVPVRCERSRDLDPIGLGEPTRDVLAAGHPDPDDEVVADRSPDRLEDLDREAHPVRQRAAVCVGPVVDERRPERIDEVAVRLDLQPVEAALLASPRSLAERSDDPADVGELHLLGERAVGRLADRRRRDRRQPVAVVRHRPAAHVGQLDHRRRAVCMHPVGELPEPRDDVVVARVQLAEDRR